MSKGLIVKTKTGQHGTTKNDDELVNDKIIVYLEDDEGKPVMEGKQQKKLLCNPDDLIAYGFVD